MDKYGAYFADSILFLFQKSLLPTAKRGGLQTVKSEVLYYSIAG
jgi:hypothetical protein